MSRRFLWGRISVHETCNYGQWKTTMHWKPSTFEKQVSYHLNNTLVVNLMKLKLKQTVS